MSNTFRDRWVVLVLLACSVTLFRIEPAAAVQNRTVDAFATELLERMGEFVQTAEKYTYIVKSVYAETLDDGSPFELDTEVRVAVRRPDRFWVDVRSDEVHNRFLYDGETLQIQHLMANLYATAPAPATIDATLQAMEDKLGVFIPLPELISSAPYEQIMDGVEAVTYLGLDDVDGVTCHHLFVEQETLDAEVWIEDGRVLVPRKLVFNFKNDEGDPTFAALLSDWDFSPHLPDAVFTQGPPLGARRIDLRELPGDGTP